MVNFENRIRNILSHGDNGGLESEQVTARLLST